MRGALDQTIPKYQISAFLMTVYFNGMDDEETSHLTATLIESGTRLSLPSEHAPYVDKHSTGGVGDGTSLAVAPILAACGLYVPMISGRALGHTGGTLDKLDSIPSFKTQLSTTRFMEIVEQCGYAMCGQTQDLAPADKYLYALRDVTATVESIPLITSSILSKKFAEGTDVLVLDVKCGRGAFARDIDFARQLAQRLVETGTQLQKKMRAIITDMDQPLGVMIGNFLEIEQAAVVLGGYQDTRYSATGLQDFTTISKRLCAEALVATQRAGDIEAAMTKVDAAISSGHAWECFCQNVSLQGGEIKKLQGMFGARRAAHAREVKAQRSGYVSLLDAYAFGTAAATLGVGRLRVESQIDAEAGIRLHKKAGARVVAGEPLCTLYSNTAVSLDAAEQLLQSSGIEISETAPAARQEFIRDISTAS